MGMQVRKGAKVSYEGMHGETIVGVVVGFGGSKGRTPLVMSSGDFIKSWMHEARTFKVYDSVGGAEISLPVVGGVYYYILEKKLKVLGYE